jgi:hypothetical protein
MSICSGRDIRAISSFGYKLSLWFFRTGKMMSSWVVVCFCVERFVAVLFLSKVKILFSKRRRYVIIAIIAIRKTLADNLENGFALITHIVRTFPTNPAKRLAGIHITLRTWTNFNNCFSILRYHGHLNSTIAQNVHHSVFRSRYPRNL